MVLENIAEIIVGQIMPRVTANSDKGEQGIKTVSVLTPKSISEGIVVKDDLGKAVLNKEVDINKYTKEGDVVIKLSTPYDAAYITKEFEELLVPSFCAVIRLNDLYDEKYLTAYLNTSYLREMLKSKVVGSARPMIKVTDIRALELPLISKEDMKDIGEAFILSSKKKSLLREMIDLETDIMESVVLNSIKEVVGND